VTKKAKVGCGVAVAVFLLMGLGAATVALYFLVNFQEGRTLFNEGYAAMNRGQYDTAISCFDAALRKKLTDYYKAYAYEDRAFCENRKGRCDEALRDYSEAIKAKPNLGEAYAYRGALHDDRKEKDDAFSDYSEAIRYDPNIAWALYRRGLIFMKRKEPDKAIADFSEAIRASPDSPVAYTERGIAYALKRQWDSALASLDAAIGIDPKSRLAYEERAYVYRRKDQVEKAIADYTEAIRLDPKRSQTLRSRALLLNKVNRLDEAIADFTQAIRLNPKDQFSVEQLARAYDHKGDPQRAIVDFSALINVAPSRKAYEYRARAYAKKGDYTSAMSDFKQARQMDGDGLTWGKGLAWLLSTCPDASFRNGKQAIAEATKDCESMYWNNWNCVDTLAAAYAEDKDFEQAVQFEQEALLKPDCNDERRAETQKRLGLYKKHLPYRDMLHP
jgi:tetratricopeptide (TPR) repeat protein